MNITEVRVRLVYSRDAKLRAFCSITIDDSFVIKDLKIIEGNKGLFVAMPSQKLSEKCSRCGGKNHLRAKFCNYCGARLPTAPPIGPDGKPRRFHTDTAHPVNMECRQYVHKVVLDAYKKELANSGTAEYAGREAEDVSTVEEIDEVDYYEEDEFLPPEQPDNHEERSEEDNFGKGIF